MGKATSFTRLSVCDSFLGSDLLCLLSYNKIFLISSLSARSHQAAAHDHDAVKALTSAGRDVLDLDDVDQVERVDGGSLAHDTSLFRRLVLGWIEADLRVQIRILQHFSKSTRLPS